MGFGSLTQTENHKKFARQLIGINPMKRSRRVVLTMMGTAAIGAVSMGFTDRGLADRGHAHKRSCGPGLEPASGPRGRRHCRAVHGGFGRAMHRYHGHGMHGHAGG